MEKSNHTLSETITGIPACIILSLSAVTAYFVAMASGASTGAFMVIRVIISVITFAIAMVVASQKRHSLFIHCVFFGLMCFFLFQLWNFANFLWIANETGDNIVETISVMGFNMFLFSASFGALDSLADDGSKALHKYRLKAFLLTAVFIALFLIKLLTGFSILVCVYGIVLCPLIYLGIKHILIPDIDSGFVRVLRTYYVVVLILVLAESVEALTFGLPGYGKILAVLRGIITIIAIWLFPMAMKGVRQWTSL
ncbi:MAG: hypothetical protein E7241_02070 [Lachnospiraceae bacterium]|nr:hypothetical protein [Lachnospiraceae bacterium]